MKLAYFDCFAGAAGDMIVGALLDAGCPFDALAAELARLELPGVRFDRHSVNRGGLSGTKFEVADAGAGHDHHRHHDHGRHRPLSEILRLIDAAGLPDRAAGSASAVFRRLGEAEARCHNVPVEQVHFHEVGAADSIADIVGAAVALELLNVERVVCSPLPTGSGTIETAHGTLPVPAPATAALLKGARIAAGPPHFEREVTTPTAAAILTTLAESFGPAPPMAVEAVGYGAGSYEDGPVPNLLRVFLGRPEGGESAEADTVIELSANLDDCTGQLVGAAIERLLAAGALDAWAAPVTMKKSRPGWMLSVLCLPADAEAAEEILFVETTTLGVRRRVCTRSKLVRRHETVETPYGPVRVKVSGRAGRDLTATPEFADAAAAASAHGAAVREVIAAAADAWRRHSEQSE